MTAHFFIEWNRGGESFFENQCFAGVKNRRTNCMPTLFTLIYAKCWSQICKYKIIQYIIQIAQYLRFSHRLRTNPHSHRLHSVFIFSLHCTLPLDELYWLMGVKQSKTTSTSLPLKMGPMGCPKTSVNNYHLPRYENYKQVIMKWWVDSSVLTNIPKEQADLEELCSSGLDQGCTNPKFCVFGDFVGPQNGTCSTPPFWRLEY